MLSILRFLLACVIIFLMFLGGISLLSKSVDQFNSADYLFLVFIFVSVFHALGTNGKHSDKKSTLPEVH